MKYRFLLPTVLLTVMGLGIPADVSAQRPGSSDPFVQIDEATLLADGDRLIVPDRYRTMTLDPSALHAVFRAAPMQFSGKPRPTLDLPLPDGSTITVEIERSPMMEPDLASRYPQIRTFRAYETAGAGEGRATGRLGWTDAGFHAILFTDRGTVFIDRYSRGTTEHYISYFKRDFHKPGAAEIRCDVHTEGRVAAASPLRESGRDVAKAALLASGTELRTYRLAMAANYEYTQFHTGPLPTLASKSAALNNGIIPTMNRVNAIYERDVAATMVLIAGEEEIIWDHPGDPYTNEDGLTMLEQNRVVLTGLVGNANYDIGHVFSTGGGGIAGLGVVCLSGASPLQNHKAYGVTGSPAPVGDPFDVDFVAHEIGHQFGANHTFNGNAGSCGGGNRNAGTAYEVGSGTTIMAYAGICGAQNVQLNSDDYFHVESIDEIVAFSTAGAGNNCAVITSTGNTPPAVDAGANFTIPMGTPFTLTATGSDADGDPLTYCWEEHDLGPAGDGATDNGSSPIFRSFSPVASPARTFPRLADVLGNVTTYGETLPTTNRVMNFRVTARDNRLDGGGVEWDEIDVTVTTSAGPFLVEAPNGGELWTGGVLETVAWDVARTTDAPVSTPTVNILLSIDGGWTFPIVLATGVPNDGMAQVVAPNIATDLARIKVEGGGNVFFDVSNAEFTIEQSTGPPVATDDWVRTAHNAPIDIFVLANDSDPDNDPLSIVAVGSPTAQGGTATMVGDHVRYTPADGFDGVDTFEYTVSDGTDTDTGLVQVVVSPACPSTRTGGFFDDFESLGPGWTVDTDVNASPASATWTPIADNSSHSPAISFMSDSSTLAEKDDRLIAPPQSISSTTHLTFWHRFRFEDGYDGGVLEVSLDGGQGWQDVIDAGGVFLSEGYNSTISGGFGSRIAGRDAWSGDRPALPTNQNQFQVEVDLGALNPNDLAVTALFRWRLVGDPLAAGATPGLNWLIDDVAFTDLLEPGICTGPVAIDDLAETAYATPVVIDLLANDYHPADEAFSVQQVDSPANGSAADNGDGTATYSPNVGFSGTDSFSYTICDLDDECDTALVQVQVQEGNLDPVATDDEAGTQEDQAVTIAVLANDSDPEGDPLAITRVQHLSDQGGSVAADDNGTPGDTTDDRVAYSPAADFFGTDTFTYTIGDGQGGSAQGVVTVTVDPVNDAPLAQNDDASTFEDTSVPIPVLDNDSDADGDALTVGSVSQPASGTTAIEGTQVRYDPAPGFFGIDTFSYEACDNGTPELCGSATVTVTVERSCVGNGDSDNDGTPDCDDECPNDPDKTEAGECGCGQAEGTCSSGRGSGKVKGSGYFLALGNLDDDDSDSDNLSFSIEAEYKKDGELKGKLKLKDRLVDVKIDAKTILTFGPGTGVCNGMPTGVRGFEFTAEGKFNGEGGAIFRVCGEDLADPSNSDDDSDSDSDSDAESRFPDRLHIECLAGCTYSTSTRTADDLIDGGNISVRGPIVDGSGSPDKSASWSTGAGELVAAIAPGGDGIVEIAAADHAFDGEDGAPELLTMTQVVELDPLLLGEAPAGIPMVLTATATATEGISVQGRGISLRWRTADGTRGKVTAVVDALGVAAFPITVQPGNTVYHVRLGRLGSNRVVITGR